jgi:heat shock protein HtpX
MKTWLVRSLVTILLGTIVGCAAPASGPASGPTSGSTTTGGSTTSGSAPTARKLDAREAERLRRVALPLLKAMNNPRPPSEVKVGIMDDPTVNAASGGGGEFYVTTGLLKKANDRQLAGVLAHELAHDDLGHVAKAQALATGLGIGMIILDQIIPGSGQITPIAGTLVARAYGRNEEYAADRHGMTILQRAGYPKEVMIETLDWLIRTEGGSSGGFFATHPATTDRIEALRRQ